MIVFNLYRGKKPYTYSQVTKAKTVTNPVSGHSWTENTPVQKWEISSPRVGVIEKVNSEEKARKLCEEYGEVDVWIPLTSRELEKLRPELEK